MSHRAIPGSHWLLLITLRRSCCHARRLLCSSSNSGTPSAASHAASPLVSVEPGDAAADRALALADKSHSLWQKLAYLKPDSPPGSRLLKVAVLGPTGVGKSSLVNMLACYRSCAVSQKINTTRSKQAVISTRGNTQLVFVDLPGLLSEQRRRRFNLENYIMRDVHSAVFQADLILVLSDFSHRPSRTRLDPELLKALHYFADKPAILVLNKTDLLDGSRTKLLDAVRALTDGFVAGRISHVDCYASRIAAIDATVQRLLADEGRAPAMLPSGCELDGAWHGRWDRRWERHLVPPLEQLQRHLVPPPDVLMWGPNPPAPTPLLTEAGRRALLPPDPASAVVDEDERDDERLLTTPEARETAENSEDRLPAALLPAGSRQLVRVSQLDPFTLWLREQMLIGSVSKAEAMARRRRWREIARLVVGQVAWRGFQEVFMVSAATGDGVDALRDYLFSIAPPAPWLFHSSCLSDMDPEDLVRMCVWARCLDLLPQEVPYKLGFELLDLDRSPDGRVFVSVRILCASLRAMACVLGQDGGNIKEIAARSKQELQDIFRADVTLKLAAVRATIPGGQLSQIKRATSLSQLFPDVMH